MATDTLDLYNWVNRYLVTAPDMQGMQNNLEALGRGRFEGLAGKTVLLGGTVSISPTGLNTPVDLTLAVGPTGNFMLTTGVVNVVHTAPVSLPQKNLVVIRPNLINENYITDPTNPFNTVPLNTRQSGQIVLLAGTPAAQPTYAATGANDVVLFGVTILPGQTTFTTPRDLDTEIRDIWGKNSQTQKAGLKYDDRCRPYYFSNTQVGVKASQTTDTVPKKFTYVGGGVPSKFPMDGSSNFATGDTVVDFAAGTFGGADQKSGTFTPTIPTAGNYIVATIALNSASVLTVKYGTQGTLAQCYAGINNATQSGAGSVSYETNKMKIAYVIVASDNGTTIRDLILYDARSDLNYPAESPNPLTTDTTVASTTIAAGSSLLYGKMNIASPQAWIVNGSLFAHSSLIVATGASLVVNAGGLVRVI